MKIDAPKAWGFVRKGYTPLVWDYNGVIEPFFKDKVCPVRIIREADYQRLVKAAKKGEAK